MERSCAGLMAIHPRQVSGRLQIRVQRQVCGLRRDPVRLLNVSAGALPKGFDLGTGWARHGNWIRARGCFEGGLARG